MLNREAVQRLLEELAKDLGFDELTLGEDGTCTLVFDDALFVEMFHDEAAATLGFEARLGEPPLETAATVHRQLLQANALWRETGGLVFALDGGTGEILMQQRVDTAGLDFVAFRAMLERFVEAAGAWAGAVQQAGEGSEPDAAAPGPLPMLRV
jgi:hypothetical protein